jgi:putative ABC transport system permease protein
MNDFRFALRSLRKTPGFATIAVLTLALGIGANTAIFSVVDGVLLRPAPFPDMNRLVMVWETDRKSGTTREPASVPDYQDFQQRATQFASLSAFAAGEATLTPAQGDPSRLAALAVSHDFLSTVGIAPLLGRDFRAEEDQPGGPAAVLISERLWEQLFSRDPNVLGRTLRLDDVARPIVGVVPDGAEFGMLQVLEAAAYSRGFADRGGRVQVDVWVPLKPNPLANPRYNHPIFILGRLRAQANRQGAQQEMAAIAADLERTYPSNADRGVNVEPLAGVIFGPVRPALLVLLGAVALVLLVACANVANLLLVRGTARAREVSVRLALGASGRRLARQFVIEGVVLTLMGAAGGVVLALWALRIMLALAPADIPRVAMVGLNLPVLALTLGVSVVAGLAFGVLPMLQARRRDLQAALQGESRGTSVGGEQRRLRSGLVVAELALAVTLMIGAGLLIRSLWRLQQVNPGFHPAGVLKAEYQLPATRYPRDFSQWPDFPAQRAFNDELLRRVRALPGVTAAAIASNHPLDAGFTSSIRVVGREAEAKDWPEPRIRLVTAGYLETVGLPMISGRRFRDGDALQGPPVILVNEAAQRRYFAGQNPIGQRINLWGANRMVVGVVGNERLQGLAAAAPPAVYLPLDQAPSATGAHSLLIRSSGDPLALAPAVRATVRQLDSALPLFGVEPLEQTLSNSLSQRRFTMLLLGAFAALAFILSAIGVHGVLSYSVVQRTREIGIRVAMGADAGTVRGLVVTQGATLVALGLGLGLVGALGATRALRSLLYGVGAGDPITFLAAALALGGVALLAAYLPARRATRIAPMEALRHE